MLIGPQNLPENLQRVRERIAAAAAKASRDVSSITLLGASKAQPTEAIRTAAALGVRDFGENYLQEALEKIQSLREVGPVWHFIGQVQANKTRVLAEQFAWVHGVDRLRIAERLSAQRPPHLTPLNVCIQVNIGDEASKAGAAPADVPALAASMAKLPQLALRGLMCLPPAESAPERQRHWFALMRELLAKLNRDGLSLDTLSMGMSDDLEAAILEGSTIVRIGTALFGARR